MKIRRGSPRAQLRGNFPGLWKWYDAHGYPDPSQPVRSALVEQVVIRLSHLIGISNAIWLGSDPNPNDPSDDVFLRAGMAIKGLNDVGLRIAPLYKDTAELIKWIVPDPDAEQIHNMLVKIASTGRNTGAVMKAFLQLMKMPRGRRSTASRRVWVRAYEQKVLTRKSGAEMSWWTITKHLCDCGKGHTRTCQKNIRQGVRTLERFLKNHRQCNVPPLV